MKWAYSDYPVMQNGKPVLTSGEVVIEMTARPELPVLRIGEGEVCVIPRPVKTPYLRWRITSDVSDDLARFIRGKYWPRIETALLAEYLRERGMDDAADTYDRLLGLPPRP